MKFDIVTIHVTGWGKAVEWYTRVLGLTVVVREDDDRFALLRGEDGAMLGISGEEGAPKKPLLYFQVRSLEEEAAKLKVQDVVAGEVEVLHWGKRMKVVDPSGNEFYLYEEKRNF